MSSFNRIAISGKMCSGKTTIANMLINEFGYVRMSFATEVKILGKDIANYNRALAAGLEAEPRKLLLKVICDDIHRITTNEEEYNRALTQVLKIMEEFKHITHYDPASDKKTDDIRKMLQKIGTEYMRNEVNDNIWTNALEKELRKTTEKVIIDDVRFPNEFEMLRKNGFVMIRLQVSREVQERRLRKLYGQINESKLMHSSETALDYTLFDYVIDSDLPVQEVLDNVRSLLGGKI